MVLLRAVGHVLDKVDASRDPVLAKAVATWWVELKQSKPEPRIYWGFIDEERNSILKEYKSRAALSIETTVASFHIRTHEPVEPSAPRVLLRMEGGDYSGQDQIKVVQEAILWWERQLESITSRTTSDAA